MTVLTVSLPLRLWNPLNVRVHWRTSAKRAREQRAVIRMRLAAERAWPPRLPVEVTVTRLGPKALDSHDGLRASAKHVVDGIADALGLANDADPRVTWKYAQERGAFGVRVTVSEVLG